LYLRALALQPEIFLCSRVRACTIFCAGHFSSIYVSLRLDLACTSFIYQRKKKVVVVVVMAALDLVVDPPQLKISRKKFFQKLLAAARGGGGKRTLTDRFFEIIFLFCSQCSCLFFWVS
jgi:hypothetical protein